MSHYTNETKKLSTPLMGVFLQKPAAAAQTAIKGGEASNKPVARQESAAQPSLPIGKTGVMDTLVRVDWLNVTFPVSWSVEKVIDFLGIEGWVDKPFGGYHYHASKQLAHTTLYYDGSANMGVHLRFSGKGCRELEFWRIFENWPKVLSLFIEQGCKFSRLDLALDDYEGRITRERIQQAIDANGAAGRHSKWDFRIGGKANDGGKTRGFTYTFGSRMSETFSRIYDKSAEQGLSESYHWIRFEVEFKKERAGAVAAWIASRDTMEGLEGLLLDVLDFKEEGKDSNRARRKTASWWHEFLACCEKVRLAIVPTVPTFEKMANWFVRQVTPTLAFLLQFPEGLDLLRQVYTEGPKRWNVAHRALLPPEHVPCFG
jgi:phage replication initiation protein